MADPMLDLFPLGTFLALAFSVGLMVLGLLGLGILKVAEWLT